MKYKALLLNVYFIIIIIYFFGRNFSTGVAYADDAYFACVAKNLANGLGYGSCIEGRGFIPFDPEISTGITVIFPVAIGIYLFGNKWYVPGMVCVFIWSFLLITIYKIARKHILYKNNKNIYIEGFFFLTLVLLVFSKHFEQWSQLLGEIPAALLIVLSFLIISRNELSYYNIALSCLICAFAAFTKLIVLPLFSILFIYILLRLFMFHDKLNKLKAILLSIIFFIAPFVIFEIIKLISLNGFEDYINNINKLANFITTQGLRSSGSILQLSNLYQRNLLIQNDFGISVVAVFVTTCASLLIIKKSNGILIGFAFMLTGAILLLSCYYLIFSLGWARYYIITMVFWITLMSLALVSLKRIPGIVTFILVVGLLFFNNRESIITRINEFSNLYKMSDELKSALNCASIIDKNINNTNTNTFATQWWATTCELEYYSKNNQLFKRLSTIPEGTTITLAYRKQFLDKNDVTLEKIFENCDSIEYESADHMIINSIK